MIEPAYRQTGQRCSSRWPRTVIRSAAPGPGPDEVDRHRLVTDHCVTGIAGRQPVNPPSGSPR